uniref:Uncharacterized protein n=1 Tax=Rhizophora mucronata TaxID=61149 RepID=A0A2P2QHZ2_RHIMU
MVEIKKQKQYVSIAAVQVDHILLHFLFPFEPLLPVECLIRYHHRLFSSNASNQLLGFALPFVT